MEGKKIGLCGLRLGSSVPIFLPNIFLPFCLLQYGLQAQAKETSMKSVGTIFMLIGGSWLADNWAMAADRPGSPGAMGLGRARWSVRMLALGPEAWPGPTRPDRRLEATTRMAGTSTIVSGGPSGISSCGE